jgi:hypothetical protein
MSESQTSTFFTPVIDLLSLLIVGFLVLGVISGVVGSHATRHAPSREAVTAARDGDRAVAVTLAARSEEIARLTETVTEAERSEQALRELEHDLQERATAIATLKQELQGARTRLAELQAALADAGKKRFGFSAGAPVVHVGRKARSVYGVMLSAGRLIPIERPYFEGRHDPGGSQVIWPVQDGLTIDEALRRDSVVMKAIRTEEFRRSGRVLLLVLPDSFATFRTIRDALIRERIDFGWEPLTRTTIGINGANARTVESQAPTP